MRMSIGYSTTNGIQIDSIHRYAVHATGESNRQISALNRQFIPALSASLNGILDSGINPLT
jgi:hypothetical protein